MELAQSSCTKPLCTTNSCQAIMLSRRRYQNPTTECTRPSQFFKIPNHIIDAIPQQRQQPLLKSHHPHPHTARNPHIPYTSRPNPPSHNYTPSYRLRTLLASRTTSTKPPLFAPSYPVSSARLLVPPSLPLPHHHATHFSPNPSPTYSRKKGL